MKPGSRNFRNLKVDVSGLKLQALGFKDPRPRNFVSFSGLGREAHVNFDGRERCQGT